jgi:hypothetical protein
MQGSERREGGIYAQKVLVCGIVWDIAAFFALGL